jgi:hypothetical protein
MSSPLKPLNKTKPNLAGMILVCPEIQSSERDLLRKENNYQPYIK